MGSFAQLACMETRELGTAWDSPFLSCEGGGALPLPWALFGPSLNQQNLTLWEFGPDPDPVCCRGCW